jgi:hypothetical protein
MRSAAAAACCLLAPPSALAQGDLALQPVATGVTPYVIAAPPGDSSRLMFGVATRVRVLDLATHAIADHLGGMPPRGIIGTAVIGGYVYRGSAMGCVYGHYFFADMGAGVYSLHYFDGRAADVTRRSDQFEAHGTPPGTLVFTLGEDAAGELYVGGPGGLYRITGVTCTCDRDFTRDGNYDRMTSPTWSTSSRGARTPTP